MQWEYLLYPLVFMLRIVFLFTTLAARWPELGYGYAIAILSPVISFSLIATSFAERLVDEATVLSRYSFWMATYRLLHHVIVPIMTLPFGLVSGIFGALAWFVSIILDKDGDGDSWRDIFLGPGRFTVSWGPRNVDWENGHQLKRDDPSILMFQTLGLRRLRCYDRRYGILSGYRAEPCCCSGTPTPIQDPSEMAQWFFSIHWLLISVPYDYVVSKVRKPPDIRDVKCLLGTVSAIMAMSWLLLHISKVYWRILGVRFGWIQVPVERKHGRRNKRDRDPTKPGASLCTDSCPCERKHFLPSSPKVLATIPALASLGDLTSAHSFDSDGTTVVCDNSATGHICNDKSLFVGELRPATGECVMTVGGDDRPAGVGTVEWSWLDDDGERHTYRLHDVYYLPGSPVNLLSVTQFAMQLDDSEQTEIRTKMRRSTLIWDKGRYRRTFYHPTSGLPELPINAGTSRFRTFCSRIGDHCKPPSFAYTSAHSRTPNSIGIAIMADDEGDSVANHEGDDASASRVTVSDEPGAAMSERASIFGVNDVVHLRLDMANLSTIAKILSVEPTDGAETKYTVEDAKGERYTVTRECLYDIGGVDIADIPSAEKDFESLATTLSAEELVELYARLTNPSSLTPAKEEFISWHHRLNHLPFPMMKRLAEMGVLPKRLASVSFPRCASCMFGKAHRKPWRTSSASGSIRNEDDNQPGRRVSIDQLVSAQPGLVPAVSGHLSHERIVGSTVFVDHFSGHVHVHLMRSLSQEETLAAKAAYEKLAADSGVTVLAYHADNGRFAESAFRDAVDESNQRITFCGVGAHHQNAIVERMIKELTLRARTMLLHANRHWPEYITTMLWPFALKCAAEQINTLSVDEAGVTPESKFTGVPEDPVVKHHHTWGCPVYILDGRLQSGPKAIPKWEPRSRIGIYLGHSPVHAGSVALVLNPATGHVSPQYHCVFDDDFTTVSHMRAGTIPPHWAELCATSTELVTDADIPSTFVDDAAASGDVATPRLPNTAPGSNPFSSGQNADLADNNQPMQSNPVTISRREGEDSNRNLATMPSREGESSASSTASAVHHTIGTAADQLQMPSPIDLATSGLRRSQRSNKGQPTQRKFAEEYNGKGSTRSPAVNFMFAMFCLATTAFLTVASARQPPRCYASRSMRYFERVNTHFDGTINQLHAMTAVFAAECGHNDVYTFKEMLQQPDAGDFINAMQKEIDTHSNRAHWELMRKSELPRDDTGKRVRTIMSIWSFKRKRTGYGEVTKHKARLCAHGGQQQWGVNYWETYAPVVDWMAIRLLLVLAEVHGLETRSIDFVLAFPQADLDVAVFMELPTGMDIDGDPESHKKYCLRLKKSLYGLKQAGANWFECLKKGLMGEGRDFIQSNVDPCVFYKEDTVMMVYVDDCIIISKSRRSSTIFYTH